MKLLYEQLIKLKENLEQQEFSSLPTGGSTDQVLSKASDEDYDFKWRSVENQTGPSSSITEDELDKIWDEKIT